MVTPIAGLTAGAVLVFSLLGAGTSAAAPPSALFGRLTALEDRAERIAGGEQTGAAARIAAAQIVARWPALRSSFAANPAARWSLSAVDGEVAALRSARGDLALQRAANETTGALAPLFEMAGDRIPVAVHLLDYLGRSIALDARSGDWTRGAADGANLERTWLTLRPVVIEHRGGTAAAATDRAIAAVKAALRARNAAGVGTRALGSGNAVDLLEKVFGG